MPIPEWFASGQDENRFLRRVLDHVSDCLVAVDTAGRIVLINSPYCRLLGGTEDDFIGRHITEVVSPRTRLHHVAQGEGVVIGEPLDVRGHRLITRQVPVYQDDRIIGAVGMALFSNYELLKKAFTLASNRDLSIDPPRQAWIAHYGEDDIIGCGARMAAVKEAIRNAAAFSLPVLIQGETGTGKELAANAIHALSDRAQRPFVWLNCASIPENLIDTELFGYEGGAFTGARTRGKPGKFELANGGTLFLDEIGDMPLHLQASLLRAIKSQEIVHVGGLAPIRIDVRIICATNRPLRALVREGKFRQDLYYRLNVLEIQLPALRERDDFRHLAEQLLERLAHEHGMPLRSPSEKDMGRLLAHDWPGNVRELEGVLMRFLVHGKVMLAEDGEHEGLDADGLEEPPPPRRMCALHDHLHREKMRHIQRALREAEGDREKAAGLLGVSRSTLYRELSQMAGADAGDGTATV